MLKIKKCLNCGKEHRNKKYCSEKCNRIFNWKKENSPYKTEKYRNKISIKAKERIKLNGHPRGMLGKKQTKKNRKIVSEICKKRVGDKHPCWIGGTQTYWNGEARKVMKDIPNICIICGSKEKIRVHHLNRNIKNNNKSNLIKVCEKCHFFLFHNDRVSKMLNGYKKYIETRKNGKQ